MHSSFIVFLIYLVPWNTSPECPGNSAEKQTKTNFPSPSSQSPEMQEDVVLAAAETAHLNTV